MLKQMRAQTKKLRPILWLVIAAFLIGFVWMFQGGGGGASGRGGIAGASYAAKVGGQTVSVERFHRALENQDRYLRQMLGDSYKPSFLNPQNVMDQLVDRALMLEEADRLGIVVTPQQVATELRGLDGLKDEDGNFDRARYDQYLQYVQMRPEEFEAEVGDDLRIRQLDAVIRGGVTVTDDQVKRAWLDENETATIEYTVVPLSKYESQATFTDADLRAHFDSHASDFDAGPARRIQWIRFSRDDIQKGLEKEADIRAYYDENLATIYTMSDAQRRASLILLAVPPGASASARDAAQVKGLVLANRARNGEDFAALVKEASDDASTKEMGGDLGPFYQGALQPPEVDAAVFAAAEGDVVGPIETPRGFEIYKVTKGPGEKPRTFEDVRPLITRGLYAKQVTEAMQAAVKSFQDSYATKPDFAAAAAAAGLQVGGPAWVTESGEIPGLGRNPVVTAEAFQLDVDAVSEPLAEPGGQVVINVLEKRESSPRTFEEAKADVEQAVRTAKARELARVDAEAIRSAAATAGTIPVADDRKVETAGPFSHAGPIQGLGAAPDVLKAVFETNAGEVGRVADSKDGEVVFRVTERKGFDQAAFDAGRAALARRLQDQAFQLVERDTVSQLRKANKDRIEVNAEVLAPFLAAKGT